MDLIIKVDKCECCKIYKFFIFHLIENICNTINIAIINNTEKLFMCVFILLYFNFFNLVV